MSVGLLRASRLATLTHAVGLAGPCWALRLAERPEEYTGQEGQA